MDPVETVEEAEAAVVAEEAVEALEVARAKDRTCPTLKALLVRVKSR